MERVTAGALEVAFIETGPASGPPAILLHGFPYDARAFDGVVARLAAMGRRCIVPFLRGYGPTRFVSPETPRSGQQAALAADLLALMDALAIPQAVLGGFDWGGRAACIVAALWPERVRGLVTCGSPYNIQNIAAAAVTPASPDHEHRAWYTYYFQTQRGREALVRNRAAFCRHLWSLWSPEWAFDEAFATTAASFDNPDFVEVVIHSYRHRLGAAPGDPAYEAIEARLAAQPSIAVPTIALAGEVDGVDPPQPRATFAKHFPRLIDARVLPGVGHNPPAEAPDAFAEAVLTL